MTRKKSEGRGRSDFRQTDVTPLPSAACAGHGLISASGWRFPVSCSGSLAVTMELLGEYIGQEGKPQKLRVSCEAPGDGDPFRGLLSGVAQMKELVTELFGPLVQAEVQHRVAAAPDEALDGDDEDDAEDENNIDNRTNFDGPSAKRPKPPS
ncbi:PREDICTED: uncharacterized protein C14orf142 homolog [Rhinopithecus bieti]|nr:PREDICTED: uncharacterized protein C14orf142 homolog [Rhinopithecus bieti]